MRKLLAFTSVVAPAALISALTLGGPMVVLLLLGFISLQDLSGLILIILALILVPGIVGIIIA